VSLNDWTYFNETDCSYLLPSPRDTDDIVKVTGSKVKVTENISQKYGFKNCGSAAIDNLPSTVILFVILFICISDLECHQYPSVLKENVQCTQINY